MKTALITTTINVPTVLELYRRHGPDVAFFVAGDQKSPHDEIENLADRTGGYFNYLSPNAQTKWKCFELIGWNSIQRRNIALLEALKWGADIIVSIDDDNVCLNRNYFRDFQAVLHASGWADGFQPRYSGIKISSDQRWFDVGQMLDPVSPHRGFPVGHRGASWRAEAVTNAKVGVAAGICLGDPDIGATTRIEHRPTVHRVSQLLESGIVVDTKTWTVFNSQNTALIRELAPAFFMIPGVGRYDDIYASLIMQKVMHARGYHVHFGKPFVWQQRNEHNFIRDLRGEIDGMEKIEQFQNYLVCNMFAQPTDPVLTELRAIWMGFDTWIPFSGNLVSRYAVAAALAFLDDVEGVL